MHAPILPDPFLFIHRARRWPVLAALAILALLTGCGTAPAPTAAPTLTLVPTDTATPLVVERATATPTAVPVVTVPPQETLDTVTFTTTDHVQGAASPVVTMILYADFQCRPCADVARSLSILTDRYPDGLQVIWRHFPDIATHDKAALALLASEAAGAQNRFWEMHDLLYAELETWIDLTPEDFRARLDEYAQTLELDQAAFATALDQEPTALVEQYRLEALALDLRGVPSLLVNGQPYSGRYDLAGLDEAYRVYALAPRQYDEQPALVIDLDRTYRAVLVTEHGDVQVDLFTDRAPVAVNNFVFLAREGWHNDITFHRVLPGLFAQTGDPSGTGLGGPGYTILDEHDNGLTFDREGLLAMASTRGLDNSGGAQFFITFGPLQPPADWNGQFTIFGIVTDGMDAIRALTPRDPLDPVLYPDPAPGDRLIRVEIIEE